MINLPIGWSYMVLSMDKHTMDKHIEKNPKIVVASWDNRFLVLKKKYHIWLEENNIKYSLKVNNDSGNNPFWIDFESIEEALLFKLTWGGL